ncbi:MAG: Trm112 family protein [Planctomycetota bacterium]|nr:MAG: Trm112 family protein [Planctomycetota bacterium]
MLDERLLKILACPLCVADKSVRDPGVDLKGDKLVCRNCGRRYAIVDGIPNMIPEEAELPERDER